MPSAALVLILVSANAEWLEVRKVFPGARYETGPYGEHFETAIAGHRAAVVHGGWGKISAAASAEWAIARFRPDLVVNLGTCGGIRGRVERFANIAATRTLAYDIVEQMGDPEAALRHYATELDTAWTRGTGLIAAPMLSADRDLMAADIPKLVDKYGAIAVDWESASIAWVASKHGIRAAIVRGVSDLVGPAGGDAYGNEAHFRGGTAVVMKNLFRELPDWLRALRSRDPKLK